MIDQINSFDPNSLNGLKRLAGQNTPEANKAVAQQFEALFMQVVLKNMRDTVPQGGMFDSETTRTYQSMYDQQLATTMAQRGGMGLAAAIERQLNGTAAPSVPTYDLKGPSASDATKSSQLKIPAYTPQTPAASATGANSGTSASAAIGGKGFVDRLWPEAQEAAKSLGVPAHFLIGQAALETGWGKSQLRKADGSPSYNLFNIKAGKNWDGPVVETKTTEYENGVAVTRTARFRAYNSYAEAFQDYAKLIGNSDRYAKAVGQTDAHSFAKGLVAGGYATDPAYAHKLARVINGSTMRQGLLASAGGASPSPA